MASKVPFPHMATWVSHDHDLLSIHAGVSFLWEEHGHCHVTPLRLKDLGGMVYHEFKWEFGNKFETFVRAVGLDVPEFWKVSAL